jgi:hypothetical protein
MPVDEFYCFGPFQSRRELRGVVSSPNEIWEQRVQCPANPDHRNLTEHAWEELRNEHVSAQLKHNRRDHMMIWTTPWTHCLIHERLASGMERSGFTGYSLLPAEVRFRDGTISRDYQRLVVTGWGGLARPESGVRLISECKGCIWRKYSPLKDPTRLIDKSQWTGEDLFIVWPMPGDRLISRRVAEYFESARVEHCVVRRLEVSSDIDYPLNLRDRPTVGSVADIFPADLALKYRRPPEIL